MLSRLYIMALNSAPPLPLVTMGANSAPPDMSDSISMSLTGGRPYIGSKMGSASRETGVCDERRRRYLWR